ncbi:MAG TPA: hypothetical protein VJC17_03620 [Candidatus Dojkabacteria bacterium]|nr:hypothetical protein [Candidatus Dojkabacteria bacterium]
MIDLNTGLVSGLTLGKEGIDALEIDKSLVSDTGLPSILQYKVQPEAINGALNSIASRLGLDPDTFKKPIEVTATMKQLLVNPDFSVNSKGFLPPPIILRSPTVPITPK